MPITLHTKEQIKGIAFRLEEHVLRDCQVIGCTVVYDGGPYELVNTSFHDCQWSFRESARNTFQLLQTLGMLKQEQTPTTPLSTSTTVN